MRSVGTAARRGGRVIQIVWQHGNLPVVEATKVNISANLCPGVGHPAARRLGA